MKDKDPGNKRAQSTDSDSGRITISEWERLIRAEEFSECPICGGEFVVEMGCRKICSCGYMEGCED